VVADGQDDGGAGGLERSAQHLVCPTHAVDRAGPGRDDNVRAPPRRLLESPWHSAEASTARSSIGPDAGAAAASMTTSRMLIADTGRRVALCHHNGARTQARPLPQPNQSWPSMPGVPG
jgi:hypothetical protein